MRAYIEELAALTALGLFVSVVLLWVAILN